MDKLTKYRQIIIDLILKYSQFQPSHGEIRLEPILDRQNDRYALMQFGWDRGRRIQGNLIYIAIVNEKIQIEYDGMERGITDELIDLGISEKDIILGFRYSEVFEEQNEVLRIK